MIGRRLLRTASLIALAAPLVAGCQGTVQQRLGLERPVPDEFQVVRRAPLVMPPEFTLPPPGSRPAPHPDVAAAARASLVGRESALPAAASAGEQSLLAAIRVQADPEIRRRLLEDNSQLIDLDRSRFLFVLGFQEKQFAPRGEPLDPLAEAQRLEREGRAGRVVTIRTGSEPIGADIGS